MNIEDFWGKALQSTEIIRNRVHGLLTFSATKLPYIFLSESSVNIGDTVVRKGEILVDKPSLIIPSGIPQFDGFNFEEKMQLSENAITNFLLVRGVAFPSLKYNNKTYSVNIFEGNLGKAVKHHLDILQKEEDVHSGLITGIEDCWQFSVLIFICSQVAKSAEGDFKKMLEDIRRKGQMPWN